MGITCTDRVWDDDTSGLRYGWFLLFGTLTLRMISAGLSQHMRGAYLADVRSRDKANPLACL